MDLPLSVWECPQCRNYNTPSFTKCAHCGRLRHQPLVVPDDAVSEEGRLHEEIEGYLLKRRWPYVHSRMDMPTTTRRGVADFVIFTPPGRTLIVECKSRTGKQTPEQKGFQIQCENCGHDYHLVRSFGEFERLLTRGQSDE